jgi:DNA (cytosine-5)-methyltransferase 1
MLQLSRGRALAVIVDTLEKLGYRWAYRVVDSRAFGLPQRRERVFLLACLDEDPRHVLFADEAGEPADDPTSEDTAYGFYWTEGVRGLGWAVDAVPTLKGGSTIGIASPPAIWLPSGEIVKPEIRDAERMQGFRARWTVPAEAVAKRGHRWKLVGNAVSVPVAKWIGKRLARPGDLNITDARPVREGVAWPRVAWNVGAGRMTTKMSAWPKHQPRKPLTEFLQYGTELLSERATGGFLKRTETARLRFPPGFIAAVQRHLAVVSAQARR